MNRYSLIVLITLGIIGIALFSYYRDSIEVTQQRITTPIHDDVVRTPPGVNVQPLAAPAAILYTDSGFTPKPLRIKAGTEVTFVNNSSKKMWPATGVHPTHRDYPTTGGCIGSTFDACRGIDIGESWTFKFDIPGSWSYHNHLAPDDSGTIIVE